MNKFLFFIILMMLSVSGLTQNNTNPYPKLIHVTGSAEMEVVPDEIFVKVELKEYEKRGQPKISIDRIKQEFLEKARTVGLHDSSITISDYDGEELNAWQQRRKKNEEMFASISYQVKLKTSKQMDDLVNILDDNATENFTIIRTSHSKAMEFRKQLKIQAIKAAKDKADYLARAIEERITVAVTINEQEEEIGYPMSRALSQRSFNVNSNSGYSSETTSVSDFRKIKYRFEVSVSFALQ